MPSTATDRLDGLTTSVAVKAPCRVATIANITLSGLQTIDGVALADDDRVLVKSQTVASENGVYEASSGNWSRAKDFDGTRDAVGGTIVLVNEGATSSVTSWRVNGDGPIDFGTDDITFSTSITDNSPTIATSLNTVGAIQAYPFTLGDVFRSSLYNGSTWIVKAKVELQPDYYGTITAGVNSSVVDFTDELHVVVNLAGGGTAIAECQLGSIAGYVRQLHARNEADFHARVSQASSIVAATAMACYGDSITFGQLDAGVSGATVYSPTRNGTATGFGDGSTHAHNSLAVSYPDQLLTNMLAVYGAGKITMANRGYSGDRVGIAYRRHRTGAGQKACLIHYGTNDVLFATINGTNQVGIFSTIATPNDYGGYILALFHDAYRKFVMREILRGSMVVLVSPGPFISSSGYNGSTYAAAQILKYWQAAIEQIGDEFGLAVIRDTETVYQYANPEVTHDGTHPNDFGAQVRAARYAPYFMGGGLRSAARIVGTRMLTANKLYEAISGFAGVDSTTTFPTSNTPSWGPPFFTSANGADQIIGSGGATGTMYYTVYLEEDIKQVMPVGVSSGATTFKYEADFGMVQPRARLTIDPAAARGAYVTYAPNVTLAPAGSTDYNDPGDIASHLSLLGRGLHVVGISCSSGAWIHEGLLFGDFATIKNLPLSGSATYNPASLADGAGATTTVTVTGALLGDFAEVSFSLDLQGITLTAWVSAADTVSVRFQNESGGTLDLASGTLRARTRRA